MRMPQRDLASVRDNGRLAADDRAEAALEAGLELRGHEAVVDAGLVEDGEVEAEHGQVEHHGDSDLYHTPHLIINDML